ncbi:hypothetical protein ACU4GD_08260 [Cupriavidus basilensis]
MRDHMRRHRAAWSRARPGFAGGGECVAARCGGGSGGAGEVVTAGRSAAALRLEQRIRIEVQGVPRAGTRRREAVLPSCKEEAPESKGRRVAPAAARAGKLCSADAGPGEQGLEATCSLRRLGCRNLACLGECYIVPCRPKVGCGHELALHRASAHGGRPPARRRFSLRQVVK